MSTASDLDKSGILSDYQSFKGPTPMPALPKASYELVAQALAAGKSQRDAYKAGGYVYKPANAHRLCTSPTIAGRVHEIVADRVENERKAREIATKKAGLDESWIIERAKYAVELALRGSPILDKDGRLTGQFDGKRNLKAAVDGLRLCSDFLGMRIHRQEIGRPNEFARMSDAELHLELENQARAIGLSDRAINEIAALRGDMAKH
ncbi:hypothetical protein IVA95_34345 [Bradyrhizobium sp. 157]|uniref:hypothetical protein n=1 Tax=Bradyrhizobium sp. 157 TaxID=2782631 RepID=UPI001FFA1D9F|nr:hypothetical protein [Bradyrhizobium sp. 157]MCK1642498.1 hypothetical protein [Bradyrhizobium sp. 157]